MTSAEYPPQRMTSAERLPQRMASAERLPISREASAPLILPAGSASLARNAWAQQWIPARTPGSSVRYPAELAPSVRYPPEIAAMPSPLGVGVGYGSANFGPFAAPVMTAPP